MKLVKYSTMSIMLALIACMAEFVLCWATDAVMANMASGSGWWIYPALACMAVSYLCSAVMIIIVCSLCGMRMKKKTDYDPKIMRVIMILADIGYLILLLTLFPILCEKINVGAGWGDGVYLAFVWYTSLAVAGVHLLIVSGAVAYKRANPE
ncbi:MAG: hypothetical protein IJ794_06495 [Lachnospiraceae bacterium]|nr:hypothetical protein [Lachnospiraceae bacterium]